MSVDGQTGERVRVFRRRCDRCGDWVRDDLDGDKVGGKLLCRVCLRGADCPPSLTLLRHAGCEVEPFERDEWYDFSQRVDRAYRRIVLGEVTP